LLVINFTLLSPVILLYLLKVLSNTRAKTIVFNRFYKGMQASRFLNLAHTFSEKIIPGILRPGAMERIKWHKSQGHKVVIISAMLEPALKAWCHSHEIDLLATEIEVKDSKVTGKFSSPNCYGDEKVTRLKSYLSLNEFEKVYAYGDSKGDLPMLALANEKFYKYF
jgi:phosphatidylglycerophosphatase C